MEVWAIAVLCVGLSLAGMLLGGLAMYGVARRRHRQCCKRQYDSRGVSTMEEVQMSAHEKSVLQSIMRAKGAVCLSLQLPESTLSVPMSTVIPAESIRTATPQTASPPQQQPEISACCYTPSAAANDTSPTQSVTSGLGVIMPEGPEAPATPADSTERSVFVSKATTITKPHASVVFHPLVSWSSPANNKPHAIVHTIPESMSNITAVPLKVSVLSGQSMVKIQQSPHSATISIDEAHIESISSANTPLTPLILSSPCDSGEYVVVPPSPSISSLYGASINMSGPPSVLSPRSINMNKSNSSPGSMPGPSMFSPPPIPNKRAP
ncbi:hypothetical protein IWW36_002638 [Coemansia brasiliensis]|uniref:Uncharacterized protein n=1 Tax=Coemansia brasiliensis TaxID=2650707 RepID=A0A9W8M0G1_9FUNG|nr:hypothetical protein IWW36_002638 [Coemansia brasiliensis]